MHVLDEGGEVLLPVPEWDQDDDSCAGQTVGWSEVTARWQHSCPGSVLLLQVQGVPGGGQGELLVRPNYRAGTEGKTGGMRGKTAWLSLVLVACCISLLSYNKSPPVSQGMSEYCTSELLASMKQMFLKIQNKGRSLEPGRGRGL